MDQVSTAPTPSTNSSGNTLYYVSQTVNGCESPRAAITVIINVLPSSPAVTSPVNYCQNVAAVPLTATGTNLKWYTTASGGTGNATAPTPTTSTVGTTAYYVSQTVNGCEGSRAVINVIVSALAAPPVVNSPVTYCRNATATVLSATGNNLLWYSTATGGTGNSTAPVPSTVLAGTFPYFVSQSNGCGESPRAVINVVVNPTPAPPNGLTVSAITTTSATLNWQTIPGVFYSADYKASGSSTWINVASGVSSGPVNLTNLTVSTTYNWRVGANCSNSSTNNYSTNLFNTSSHNSTIVYQIDGLGIKISPNPFSKNGIIDYIIPDDGLVTIDLLNSLGQQLQLLLNSGKIQGSYQLPITNQFTTLSGGVYFLRIRLNGKTNYTRFIKQN